MTVSGGRGGDTGKREMGQRCFGGAEEGRGKLLRKCIRHLEWGVTAISPPTCDEGEVSQHLKLRQFRVGGLALIGEAYMGNDKG